MSVLNKYIPVIFALFCCLIIASCYKELSLVVQIEDNNEFYFSVTPEMEQKLYTSVGEQYELIPTPTMVYGNKQIELDKLSLRGQSALQVRRKSFSVNLNGLMSIPNVDSTDYLCFEKFKLLSMPFDYTYIEHKLSISFLEELNLWTLHHFFTQVYINNNHQGVYMFIEDPNEYVFKEKNAHFILRRNYDHSIAKHEINPTLSIYPEQYYIDKFNAIYDFLPKFSGKQLYDSLNHYMNIENYMRKIALDFIIANGDYTDEIFFYAFETQNKQIKFDIIPWDYDDIFSKIPHEVGRAWAVGTVFGERTYGSTNEVLQELDGRILFSIEDDIDYVISKDNYLYTRYLENLEWVLTKINPETVSQFFSSTQNDIEPFYHIPEVIEQSQYDENQTSYELFIENIINKEQFLINRISWIETVLETEKQKMGI